MNLITKKVIEILLGFVIEKVLTGGMLEKIEEQIKLAIVKALANLAQNTDQTDIDDKLVAALAKAWNVKL